MINKHLSYGTVIKYNSRIYTVIDTIIEDNERRAVIEFAEDEHLMGELPKITVAPVKDLEVITDRKIINAARTRTRNAAR